MFDLLIILACLVLNAFFSAYEMAFVTISKEEISELENTDAQKVKKISFFKKRPERTLSVIQIGITFVGAIAAAVGGTGAVESLEPYFVENYGFSKSMSEAISVLIVIVPLTYATVVFGELFPKTIALKHPKGILKFGTEILNVFDKGLSPIVSFLETSTNFLLHRVGLTSGSEDKNITHSIDIGSLPGYHQKFVLNLISLKGLQVWKSMIPWEKVASLNFSDSDEEARNKIKGSTHIRYPVLDGETLVGILNIKELPDIQSRMPWQGVLRPALRVSMTDKVLEVFLRMQEERTHLSVVEDQKESFVGIITIEDILEEIVGDIYDSPDKMNRISKLLANRGKINIGEASH